jgi:hypothetical protein
MFSYDLLSSESFGSLLSSTRLLDISNIAAVCIVRGKRGIRLSSWRRSTLTFARTDRCCVVACLVKAQRVTGSTGHCYLGYSQTPHSFSEGNLCICLCAISKHTVILVIAYDESDTMLVFFFLPYYCRCVFGRWFWFWLRSELVCWSCGSTSLQVRLEVRESLSLGIDSFDSKILFA